MKKIFCIAILSVVVLPVYAQDKEEDRVKNSGTVMKEIIKAPDTMLQSVLDKTDCVVVLPSVLKFAIGIGGSYGRGSKAPLRHWKLGQGFAPFQVNEAR